MVVQEPPVDTNKRVMFTHSDKRGLRQLLVPGTSIELRDVAVVLVCVVPYLNSYKERDIAPEVRKLFRLRKLATEVQDLINISKRLNDLYLPMKLGAEKAMAGAVMWCKDFEELQPFAAPEPDVPQEEVEVGRVVRRSLILPTPSNRASTSTGGFTNSGKPPAKRRCDSTVNSEPSKQTDGQSMEVDNGSDSDVQIIDPPPSQTVSQIMAIADGLEKDGRVNPSIVNDIFDATNNQREAMEEVLEDTLQKELRVKVEANESFVNKRLDWSLNDTSSADRRD